MKCFLIFRLKHLKVNQIQDPFSGSNPPKTELKRKQESKRGLFSHSACHENVRKQHAGLLQVPKMSQPPEQSANIIRM